MYTVLPWPPWVQSPGGQGRRPPLSPLKIPSFEKFDAGRSSGPALSCSEILALFPEILRKITIRAAFLFLPAGVEISYTATVGHRFRRLFSHISRLA
jgi:hypothetical protein